MNETGHENTVSEIRPHGGTLANLLVDEKQGALLKDVALKLTDLALNERQLCDLELLTSGVFSRGFTFSTRTGTTTRPPSSCIDSTPTITATCAATTPRSRPSSKR